MPSIFAQAMKKAINNYRQILRKHLKQTDRIQKLHELGLKDESTYRNDALLYKIGYKIINDVQDNLNKAKPGYYSYSGLDRFTNYLEEYLANYELEDGVVIHRAQKASRALVKAIQLLTLPREKLDDKVAAKLAHCNDVIASCGSPEQKEIHRNTLQNTLRQQLDHHTTFYRSVLHDFSSKLKDAEIA